MKRKAIVYIDGYNLYYGLLKGTPYKWLDMYGFARALVRSEFELVSVKYFTAPIKTHPYDAAAVDRQKTYLHVLSEIGNVEIIEGFYSKHRTWAPAVAKSCGECDVAVEGLLPVYKLEEKRSDVNMAVSMVADAALDRADMFVVITGDSDQVGAIDKVRKVFKKPVVVFNPQVGVSKHLEVVATFYQNIPRDLPSRCQLPDEIRVGNRGNIIHRPSAWQFAEHKG